MKYPLPSLRNNDIIMKALLSCIILALSTLCLLPAAAAPAPRIALLGDSIPYAGQWPTLIEASLRNTPALKNAEIVNFCLPSETASGLSEEGHAGGAFPRPCIHDRLDSILTKYRPTLVIACYGMNDGMMRPFSEANFQAFKQGITKLKKRVEAAKASLIIITPPLYMADHPEKDSGQYNQVLQKYSEWLLSQKKNGWKIVDMRPELTRQIREAKQQNPGFVYAGDGVHPGQEGHLFIARAVWPELAKTLRLNPAIRFPEGNEFDKAFQQQEMKKLAWLTETEHKRPGIPKGIPVSALKYAHEDGVRVSDWHGFAKLDFRHENRNCQLVIPKEPAKNSPWIWRTEFFGHEPQADIALLNKGFHVAYVDMQDMYGAPPALDIMDQYYTLLTTRYQLSPKAVLEGFSRGGLFAFNWAARNPAQVAAIYVDAPVCDVKSWPGGNGASKGSQGDWQRLLTIYGLTEEQAMKAKISPLNNLAPLWKADIPILAVVGDADDVVPLAENTALVEKTYKKNGGRIQVIHKPGVNHHPHSLKDPAPIVNFILKETAKSK